MESNPYEGFASNLKRFSAITNTLDRITQVFELTYFKDPLIQIINNICETKLCKGQRYDKDDASAFSKKTLQLHK